MTDDFFTRLAAPFPAEQISWRVGATSGDKSKGIALAYIDARDVMERLDAVCGPAGWQARYPFAGCCEIGLRDPNTGEWVWKANGAGATDVEAEKGQFSDAFKRAAVLWGVGRYLYALPNSWFPIVPAGRSYRFSDEAQALMTQRLAAWQERHYGAAPTNTPLPDLGGERDSDKNHAEPLWRNPTQRKHYSTEIQRMWGANDPVGLRQLIDELSSDQQLDLWGDFNATQKREIKALLAQTAPKGEAA